MAQFNLEDYEPVEDRITRFYEDYENGRIVTEIEFQDDTRVIFKASLYKSESTPLWATGHAQEFRDTELKKNKWGKEYETVNYTSHLENCETSAIGRALANAGYAGGKRPSREEMTKVKIMNTPEPQSKPAPIAAEVHTPTDDQITKIRGYLTQLGVDKNRRAELIAGVKTYQSAEQSLTDLREKVAQKRQQKEVTDAATPDKG